MAGDPGQGFAAGARVPAGVVRAAAAPGQRKGTNRGVSKAWRVNAKRGGWPRRRLYDTKRCLSRGSFVYGG